MPRVWCAGGEVAWARAGVSALTQLWDARGATPTAAAPAAAGDKDKDKDKDAAAPQAWRGAASEAERAQLATWVARWVSGCADTVDPWEAAGALRAFLSRAQQLPQRAERLRCAASLAGAAARLSTRPDYRAGSASQSANVLGLIVKAPLRDAFDASPEYVEELTAALLLAASSLAAALPPPGAPQATAFGGGASAAANAQGNALLVGLLLESAELGRACLSFRRTPSLPAVVTVYLQASFAR